MKRLLMVNPRVLVLLLLAVLVLGVAGSCEREGGMYQGGSDSAPGWRR